MVPSRNGTFIRASVSRLLQTLFVKAFDTKSSVQHVGVKNNKYCIKTGDIGGFKLRVR